MVSSIRRKHGIIKRRIVERQKEIRMLKLPFRMKEMTHDGKLVISMALTRIDVLIDAFKTRMST